MTKDPLQLFCKNCGKRIFRCLDEGVPHVHANLERACNGGQATMSYDGYALTMAEPQEVKA